MSNPDEAGDVALRLQAERRLCRSAAFLDEAQHDLVEPHLAEAALRGSEERLRFVLSAARLSSWDLDLASDQISMSVDCRALFALRPDGLVSRHDLLAAFHPDDRSLFYAAASAALETDTGLAGEYRILHASGDLRWVDIRGRMFRDDGGRRQSLAGVVLDITERKRAEAVVVDQEERYRAITNSIDQMIWSTRADGSHDYYNQRWYDYTGVRVGTLGEAGWFDLFHPHDRDRAWSAWRDCLRTGEPYRLEYRLRHRSGVFRWVLARAQPMRDECGAITRWYGTCTDIHDLRTSGERIRELEERYRLAAKATSDAIWEWNLGSGVLDWNPALQDVFGHAVLATDRSWWTAQIHPDDRERVGASLAAAVANRATRWAEDYRFRRADGSYAEVFDRGFVARDDEGRALRMIGAMQDLTERRHAEAALRRLNETLEERVVERTEELAASNRQLVAQIEERELVSGTLRQMQRLEAIGQLTSGVAHDFNNLLTVIMGNLSFIQRGVVGTPMEGKLLRRLALMENAAERGAKLTASLLAFSRRQRLEPKPTDLNRSVGNLGDLLQSTMGGAVSIETRLCDDLWTALVDPTQIELVILNLAINARDALQVGGSVAVETTNVILREPPRRPEEPEPGAYVAVAVRDRGCGMSEEVRTKAFEPFFTTKEVGKGTGLGLSQVLGFAKQSGGGVRIDTAPGEGTTVWVFLPRAEREAPLEHLAAGYDRGAVNLAGVTILLVDDDEDVREVTAAMLREAGYAVLEAGSGGAGLEALDRQPVDLLLVDFAMPGMNGSEVAREAQVRRPGLPVLFVTGYTDLDAIRLVGEDRIIAKPFQFEQLLQTIDQVLGAQPSADGLTPSHH